MVQCAVGFTKDPWFGAEVGCKLPPPQQRQDNQDQHAQNKANIEASVPANSTGAVKAPDQNLIARAAAEPVSPGTIVGSLDEKHGRPKGPGMVLRRLSMRLDQFGNWHCSVCDSMRCRRGGTTGQEGFHYPTTSLFVSPSGAVSRVSSKSDVLVDADTDTSTGEECQRGQMMPRTHTFPRTQNFMVERLDGASLVGRLGQQPETLRVLSGISDLCQGLAATHPLSMLGSQAAVLHRLLTKCGEAGLSIDGIGALHGADQGLSTLVDRAQFVYYANIDPETWCDEHAAVARSLPQVAATSTRQPSPSATGNVGNSMPILPAPACPPWEGDISLNGGESDPSILAEKFQRFGLVQPAPDLPRRQRAATLGDRNRFALTPVQVEQAHEAAVDWYQGVIRTVNQLQLQQELAIGFTQFKLRAEGRYDMQVPELEAMPCFGAEAPWLPLVKEILGPDAKRIHLGVMLSLPGSAVQNWHSDGDHLSETVLHPPHCLNVFVPLVDMEEILGPTELLPASHLDWTGAGPAVKPCPRAGECLLFDYRLKHRGLANRSQKGILRPMVYITYAKPFYSDTANFSKTRYEKLPLPLVPPPRARGATRGRGCDPAASGTALEKTSNSDENEEQMERNEEEQGQEQEQEEQGRQELQQMGEKEEMTAVDNDEEDAVEESNGDEEQEQVLMPTTGEHDDDGGKEDRGRPVAGSETVEPSAQDPAAETLAPYSSGNPVMATAPQQPFWT
eukprot:COSAG02_NODE_3535_length_6595_cov_5.502771_3_plen_733_part_00